MITSPISKTLLVATALMAALVSRSAFSAETVSSEAEIEVEHAWIRDLPAVSRVNSAYMQVTNKSHVDDQLVGASVPFAAVTEIHHTELRGGQYRMSQVDSVPLPAGETLLLKSGGYHLMMRELSRMPEKGEQVPITLQFVNAGSVVIDAQVASGQEKLHGHPAHDHAHDHR